MTPSGRANISTSLKLQWADGKRHGRPISPQLRCRMIAGLRARSEMLRMEAGRRAWRTRIANGNAVSGAKGKHWTLSIQNRLNQSVAQKQRFQAGIKLTSIHKAERRGIQWKLWREAIFKRDDYTCQFCGIRGGVELHPHHIKPFSKFPEAKYDVNNGVTLCRECHLVTPSFGVRIRTFNFVAA